MDNHTLMPAWGQAVLPADTLQSGAGLPLEGGSAFVLSGAGAPLLGTNAKNASTLPSNLPVAVGKYVLKAEARALVLDEFPDRGGVLERLVKCHVVPWAKTVDVLHAPEYQRACLRGLTTCASVWACPLCSAKISVRRRGEIRLGISAWEAAGGRVVLVTYTLRHKRGDDLGWMLGAMGAARRSLKSGRAAQSFGRAFGVAGSIRSLEITYGENGWHPHYHELLFVAGVVDLAALMVQLLAGWSAALAGVGLRDITDRGVDVRAADLSVADYLSKFGHDRAWGLDAEITMGRLKQAHLGGRTPIQLLAGSVAGDVGAGDLWLAYAVATQGQVQTTWSNGLRARLGLAVAQSDAQVAASIEGIYSTLLVALTRPQWRVVRANDAIPELMAVACRGVASDLRQFLADLGVPGLAEGDHADGALARQH